MSISTYILVIVAILVNLMAKATTPKYVVKPKKDKPVKTSIEQSYDNQLKLIRFNLKNLYKARSQWDIYEDKGIVDNQGNVFRKDEVQKYLEIESQIEKLENKERRLQAKCN